MSVATCEGQRRRTLGLLYRRIRLQLLKVIAHNAPRNTCVFVKTDGCINDCWHAALGCASEACKSSRHVATNAFEQQP